MLFQVRCPHFWIAALTVIRGSGFLCYVLSVALQVHLKHFSGPQVPFLFTAMSGSMSISCFCHIPLSSACCRNIPCLLHALPLLQLPSPPFSPSLPVPSVGECSVGIPGNPALREALSRH